MDVNLVYDFCVRTVCRLENVGSHADRVVDPPVPHPTPRMAARHESPTNIGDL